MKDAKRRLTPEEIQDIKLARAIEPLRRSEAFRIYCDLLRGHREEHVRGIVAATTDIAGVLQGERGKGAIVFADLALNLVEHICKNADDLTKDSEDAD
jgi:hypothetical protein